MTLLNDIQQAAIDENANLASLLMKCRLLAHRLDNSEFQNWVTYESDGYPRGVVLPDYRKLSVELLADIMLSGRIIKRFPVPVDTVPERFRDIMYNVNFGNNISSIESMLKNNNADKVFHFPMGKCAHMLGTMTKIQGKFLDLYQTFSYGQMCAICTIVRGRVLDFTVAIQKEFPDMNESIDKNANTEDSENKQHHITQIFHNTVYGNANIAGRDAVSNVINITKGDFSKLSEILSSKGISPEDIESLKDALDSEKEKTSDKFGPKVSGWIGKMMEKAANGVLEISLEKASTFLIEAIKKYYGI